MDDIFGPSPHAAEGRQQASAFEAARNQLVGRIKTAACRADTAARANLSRAADRGSALIRQYPWTAMTAAAVAGFLIAGLWRRSR